MPQEGFMPEQSLQSVLKSARTRWKVVGLDKHMFILNKKGKLIRWVQYFQIQILQEK